MVLGNFVILFLCFLADVAVGWLGSSVVLWWVVFVWCFSVVEVLAGYCILCYLLSSKRDDSFQKTRASLPSFCPRELRQNREYLHVSVPFHM